MNSEKFKGLFRHQGSNLSIFHDLMPFRVREILLVATVYDAYILEREGQLFEQIYGEYYQLNLSSAPRVTSVYSTEEALEIINENHFDLIIIMTGIDKTMPVLLSTKVREINKDVPMLLLINNNNQIPTYENYRNELVHIDKMFVWNGDSNIFLAMIKYIEDKINAHSDTVTGSTRIILVVEDSIRYYSRYLPTLYSVIMKEVQRLIGGEDIDARYKILRMRARPKVLLGSTYEEALELFEKYFDFLLCVITDVRYPKNGKISSRAGRELAMLVKNSGSIPVLMQSAEHENALFAKKNQISYIDKNSKNIYRELADFFKLNLGFGNFIFRTASGEIVAEARYLKEFEMMIDSIPDESILFHSDRDHFSTWFMAKGEIKSALKLKSAASSDFKDPSEIRAFIKNILLDRWLEKKKDSISNFSESIFRESGYIMRVSNGSVGGKGRGIAFTESLLQKPQLHEMIKGINITIPRTVIIGTDEFENFMDQFEFSDLLNSDEDHREIRLKFLEAELSSMLSQRLKKMLLYIKSPLAVRSSGLFEDSLSQPFAGIYETYFLPNNHPDINVRLAQLLDAVKMVYASVFTPLAKSYFDSVNHSLEEEKMAVIIQELVGNSYGDHFYPHISGVAQSYNYYPFSHMKPEDGLGLLAAGLGKSIVDGSQSFRFCPKFPKMNVMTAKDLLQNSQRYIYGLNIKNNQLHLENGDEATLEKIGIDIAEKHGSLNLCASVYDNDSNSIKPGLHAPGPRIIDFRYILHYDIVPLANAVTTILDVMKSALGTPVEIEFSVDLNKDESGKCSLYILQVKPLIRTMENIEVSTDAVDKKDILLYTTRGMGNGVIEGIKDLVYVIPEKFDKMKTRLIQKEVAGINNEMKKNGLQYILMGPGRWGSSDPFLGIPADWAAISQAKVIVEAGLKDFNVDASLGSHFFHNIASMNIGYFTVPAKSSDSYIDFEHLKSMEPHNETEFLRHIRFETPLTVIMDGKRSVSIITKEHWK